jgi:hypothetical protein
MLTGIPLRLRFAQKSIGKAWAQACAGEESPKSAEKGTVPPVDRSCGRR